VQVASAFVRELPDRLAQTVAVFGVREHLSRALLCHFFDGSPRRLAENVGHGLLDEDVNRIFENAALLVEWRESLLSG
jgi:hypothetical protein